MRLKQRGNLSSLALQGTRYSGRVATWQKAAIRMDLVNVPCLTSFHIPPSDTNFPHSDIMPCGEELQRNTLDFSWKRARGGDVCTCDF